MRTLAGIRESADARCVGIRCRGPFAAIAWRGSRGVNSPQKKGNPLLRSCNPHPALGLSPARL